MKKYILIVLCVSLFLIGCDADYSGTKHYDQTSNFVNIDGERDLYYYKPTKVVYILFNELKGYGYMAPYYSENLKLCTYNTETKEIEESE